MFSAGIFELCNSQQLVSLRQGQTRTTVLQEMYRQHSDDVESLLAFLVESRQCTIGDLVSDLGFGPFACDDCGHCPMCDHSAGPRKSTLVHLLRAGILRDPAAHVRRISTILVASETTRRLSCSTSSTFATAKVFDSPWEK